MKVQFDLRITDENDSEESVSAMMTLLSLACPGTLTLFTNEHANRPTGRIRGSSVWMAMADKVIDSQTGAVIKSRW